MAGETFIRARHAATISGKLCGSLQKVKMCLGTSPALPSTVEWRGGRGEAPSELEDQRRDGRASEGAPASSASHARAESTRATSAIAGGHLPIMEGVASAVSLGASSTNIGGSMALKSTEAGIVIIIIIIIMVSSRGATPF